MEPCNNRHGVQGVVLDGALFSNNSGDTVAYLEKLLHRLSYSGIRVGILFRHPPVTRIETNIAELQETVEKCMPSKRPFDTRNSSDDCLQKVLSGFCETWKVPLDHCIFVTSYLEVAQRDQLSNQGWLICLPGGVNVDRTANHIQEIYSQIVLLNKGLSKDVVTVGYSMKWSREMDFLKRCALPLNKSSKSLSFYPMNLELSLHEQFKIIDIMLHKPTDEITCAALGKPGSLQDQIKFTDVMERSIKFLSSHPEVCVVDPIEKILPLVDRALTQEILQGLSNMEHPRSRRVRPPRYKRVLKFDNVDPSEVLKNSDFSLPAIVKSQIACGVSDAHTMAVVFKAEGFINLAVPVPSTVQEYIDHGSILYKFYVIGEKVFYSIRKSTPNAATLLKSFSDACIPSVVTFDSLKSLPKQFIIDEVLPLDSTLSTSEAGGVDLQLIFAAATWLREKLKLTIFGFDIIIELETKDHVIIDLNFFPTFKDVDAREAVPAFWDALLRAYALHRDLEAASLRP